MRQSCFKAMLAERGILSDPPWPHVVVLHTLIDFQCLLITHNPINNSLSANHWYIEIRIWSFRLHYALLLYMLLVDMPWAITASNSIFIWDLSTSLFQMIVYKNVWYASKSRLCCFQVGGGGRVWNSLWSGASFLLSTRKKNLLYPLWPIEWMPATGQCLVDPQDQHMQLLNIQPPS